MRVLLAVAVAVAAVASEATAPPDARAQTPESWKAWAREGLSILAESRSDSVGANEARAFDAFDRIAEGYFTRLGMRKMAGARGVLSVFDSLGVPVEMAQDPELPQFVVLTFFHPAYQGHAAMTYLHWFFGEEIRRQRLLLTGGKNLQLEVWWTGRTEGPYEAAILDRRRTGETRDNFLTLLRMAQSGQAWGVVQYGRRGVDLGRGSARFVDLNDDAAPELVSWSESEPDPRFVQDVHLPEILAERTWQRTDSGFVLLDDRIVATPFASFVQFLRALGAGQTATARALATSQAVVTRARNLGLGAITAKDSWQALAATGGDRWNENMSFVYGTPRRTKGLDVRMKFADGHWHVDRLESRTLNPSAPPPAVPPTPGPGR